MLFGWLKRRRRKKLLSSPFPESWRVTLRQLAFHETLDAVERSMLEDCLRVIVAEKHWEGCAGLEMDDEVRVTIAAQAALPILRIEHDYYRRIRSIFVYPSTFLIPGAAADGRSTVHVEGQPVLGLAYHGGPIVLAWDSVVQGARNDEDGRNVVIHEFAHALDLLDRYADGTPPLKGREQFDAWRRIMEDEYKSLIEKAERGRRAVLDKYGATNPAEFFAVATECFFEKPRQLESKHTELYTLLRTYFGQDPAERLRRTPGV